MDYFPLFELPEDIQAVVVECVARNSFQDLYGIRAVSKSMKALADRRRGNPSTLYIKGVQFYYTFDKQDEGLALMKRATDAGYERAVYTHTITRAIFRGEGKYFHGISTETVERIGKLVRSVKWGCGLWHADEFRSRRADFISSVVLSIYSCQCGNLIERQCMCLWHIDNTKYDNICGRCFWIKEVGLFFRDFEPISLLRDTRKW
ncbi:hypothetical protein Bca4012_065221 [Brassica carinata]